MTLAHGHRNPADDKFTLQRALLQGRAGYRNLPPAGAAVIRNWSIRNRVLLLALLPVISLGIVLSSYFVQSRVRDLKAAQATLGRTMADQLASASLYGVLTENPDALHALAESGVHEPNIESVTITGDSGQVMALVRRPMQIGNGFTDVLARRIGAKTGFEGSLVFTRPILRSVISADGSSTPVLQQLGSVTVKLSEVHFAESQARIIMNGGLILIVCLAFSILLALIISGSVVAPIERVIITVQRFTSGDHGARVAERSGGELRQLEKGINQMAANVAQSQQQLQDQIDQATADLRGTLEEFEIKSVELDLARKRALEANRVKSEFLANMSHEVRTPMNAVLGFSELLTRTPLNAGQRGYLTTIQQSAHSLLALLDNILDASRLEMSSVDIHATSFVLRDVLEETLRAHAMNAYAKQLELVLDTDGSDGRALLGDRIKLMRVLSNLVSNAVKFTDAGTVTVRARCAESAPGRIRLNLAVGDTGAGISEPDQHRLFQPFVQVHGAADRRHEGAGLGLFICKRLITLMGGTLTLHSTLGAGSEFRVQLPLPADPETAAPDSAATARHGTLLIYEPNAQAAEALQARIKRLGWSADLVRNTGEIAEHFSERHQDSHYSGLVLALGYHDLGNPAAFAAALPERSRSLPRLVLVNSVNAEVQADVGRQLHGQCLPKFTGELQLGHYLRQLAGSHAGAVPAPPPSGTLSLDGHTMVVADDNRINRLLERILLEKYGARVLEARTGRELVSLVSQHPVSLILLDMQMPGEDGWEVAAKLKAGSTGPRAIPVIALSAMSSDKSAEELDAAGLSAWLMKPLEEPALRETVARYLRIAATANSTTKAPQAPPLALENALHNLNPTVRQMLREDLPAQQAAIEAAWKQRDMDDLRQQVHKLNGSAAFCGLSQLRETCTQIELQLRSENTLQLSELMTKIRQDIGLINGGLARCELSPTLSS